MSKKIAQNSIIQTHTVVVPNDENRTSFDFPTDINMKEIYGLGFSVLSTTRELGATVGMDIGNENVLSRDGNKSVEIEAFAFNETKSLEENYLPVKIDADSKRVKGEITDTRTGRSAYKVNIYLLGIRK